MPRGVADQAVAVAAAQSPRRGVMPQSPLRIKQDGTFYERLLTKESAGGNLSFRYYWAEPGSVPFVWETQPGTPKDAARMAAGALPAITPPPSYLLQNGDIRSAAGSRRHHQQIWKPAKGKKRSRLRRIRIGFIAGIFRRLSLAKAWRRRPAQPAAKVMSSSRRWLFSSSVVSSSDRGEHHDHHEDETTAAAACKNKATIPCSSFRARPGPWLLRFRGSSNRCGGNCGWA